MPDCSCVQSCPSRIRSGWPLTTKQMLTLVVVSLVVALIAMQWHSWQSFDWSTFVASARGLRWVPLSTAIALTLVAFPLRAWRWQIFLRPVRDTRFRDVFSPTVIGFTGLALLGRPGELIRPYMIARRTSLSMASQMGVWTVERIFDMAAFAVIAVVDFFVAARLPDLHQFRTIAWISAGVLVFMAAAVVVMCRSREAIFSQIEKRAASRYPACCGLIEKARAFSDGLHTIKDLSSFLQLSALSMAIWVVGTLSCLATLHAYPALQTLSLSSAVLLTGFSMIGGLAQLPAVGGGAQLATIVAMVDILGVPRELAVSAGILLWLVSFHTVTPIGLAIARRAHISLRKASNQVEPVECEPAEPTAGGIPSGTFAQVPQ